MAFKKGQSGNPGGRAKEKVWREAVLRAVKRRFPAADGEDKDPQALDRIADALVNAAMTGDIQAIKEVGDRVDGKPAQAIVGDDTDAPIKTVMEIVWGGSTGSGS